MIPEHAGFLMALGLNGHLRTLKRLNMYEYISKNHEMTNVALLIGLSASFRGKNITSEVNYNLINIIYLINFNIVKLFFYVIVKYYFVHNNFWCNS